MLRHQLKTARRSLANNKGYALINIFGLAIGLSLCFTVYLVTGFELSFDSFHRDNERIYRMVTDFQQANGETNYQAMVPDPMSPAIQKEFTGVETVARFHNFYAKVFVTGEAGAKIFDAPKEKESPSTAILAGPEYFDIFQYTWLAGNAGTLAQPQHVVLVASQAKKYFGNQPYDEIIGRQLMYNDSLPCIVTGVVEDNPANTSFSFTDIVSAATIRSTFLNKVYELDNWQNWASKSQTFVKLRQGAQPAQFEKQSLALLKKNVEEDPTQKTIIRLQPLADMHFNTRYQDRYSVNISRTVLYTLMGIAAFVLLIAVVNFVNLSTAQSLKRAKEIGIRKVLGSSRYSLIQQFLAEALFITILAALLAALLAPLLFAFLRPLLPGQVQLHVSLACILFAIVIVLVTAMLAGIYPAKVLSAAAPIQGVKGLSSRPGGGGSYLRQGLIGFQFTISILLITGAVVMGRQVRYSLTADMGFTKTAIINIPVNTAYGQNKMNELAQLISRQNNIEMVSVDMGTPFQTRFRGTSLRCSATGRDAIEAQFQTGDERYINLYKMKLLAGRNLQPSDTMRELVINETCAKKLGFTKPADALGKMLHAGTTDGMSVDKLFPVVGVVADFHAQSFH